jgi:hypothetical protein
MHRLLIINRSLIRSLALAHLARATHPTNAYLVLFSTHVISLVVSKLTSLDKNAPGKSSYVDDFLAVPVAKVEILYFDDSL